MNMGNTDFIYFRCIPRSRTDESYGSSDFNWGTSIQISIAAGPMYIPTNSAKGSLFSTSLPTLTIPAGVRVLIFHCGLICISVMIIDVEHPFRYMLALCMPSLEKCLFSSSAHFLKYIFYWLCYYSCPISSSLFPSALHTPSPPHSPPLVHVHGPYI